MPAADENTAPLAGKLPALHSDLFRAVLILVAGCVAGLAVNACRGKPVAIFDPQGPGAVTTEPRITLDAFKALLESGRNVLLLDVREDDVFLRGHAPQAVHVWAGNFEAGYRDQSLPSLLAAVDETVVLCDNSECPLADRAASKLRELGHTHIRVLEDGWRAYEHSGLEIESGPAESRDAQNSPETRPR